MTPCVMWRDQHKVAVQMSLIHISFLFPFKINLYVVAPGIFVIDSVEIYKLETPSHNKNTAVIVNDRCFYCFK